LPFLLHHKSKAKQELNKYKYFSPLIIIFAFAGHLTKLTNFSINCNAEAWFPTSRPCELGHQKLTFVLFQKTEIIFAYVGQNTNLTNFLSLVTPRLGLRPAGLVN
jgi:hypothetical protein